MDSLDTILKVGILSMLHMSMDSVSRMGNLHAHISGRLPVVCSVEPVVVTFTLTYAVLVMRGTLLVLLHLENDYFCDSVATINNWSANPFRFYPDNALWDVSRASTHVTITTILRGL